MRVLSPRLNALKLLKDKGSLPQNVNYYIFHIYIPGTTALTSSITPLVKPVTVLHEDRVKFKDIDQKEILKIMSYDKKNYDNAVKYVLNEGKIKDPHPYPKALSEKIMSKRNLVIKPSKIHPKSIWDIDSRRKFHVDFDSGVRLA